MLWYFFEHKLRGVLGMAKEKTAFGSVIEETRTFEPSDALIRWAHVKNLAEYEEIYKRSRGSRGILGREWRPLGVVQKIGRGFRGRLC